MERNNPMIAKEFFENKITFTMGPMELNHILDEDNNEYTIIDVRAANDYEAGRIPTAINLPQDKWNTAQGLQRDKTNVFYCYSQTCHLAARAALEFARKGFSVMELEGGFKDWQDHKLEIERSNLASQSESNKGKRF